MSTNHGFVIGPDQPRDVRIANGRIFRDLVRTQRVVTLPRGTIEVEFPDEDER